ncbi:hypothetical protein WN943_026212 [Citrus x changshan-huyou]
MFTLTSCFSSPKNSSQMPPTSFGLAFLMKLKEGQWQRRAAGQLLKRKRNPWQMPAKIDEVKPKEFGEKMQSKCGQWVKTDFEG